MYREVIIKYFHGLHQNECYCGFCPGTGLQRFVFGGLVLYLWRHSACTVRHLLSHLRNLLRSTFLVFNRRFSGYSHYKKNVNNTFWSLLRSSKAPKLLNVHSFPILC